MEETSKASLRRYRDPIYGSRYFVGSGIDIGGGLDPLGKQITKFPGIRSVRNWDLNDGDAQYLSGVDNDSFDFVYSSHCLEHMHDPVIALANWLRILKPGGYLIVSIPDEDMYEHSVWPSRFNLDHKWSFTLFKDHPALPKSINVIDLLRHFAADVEPERILKIKDSYIDGLVDVDQTLGNAECAIEFVWRKQETKFDRPLQAAWQYESQGREQEAANLYVRTIQQTPLNFDAYNQLSNLLTRKGQLSDAENVWDVCVANLPNEHQALLYKALFLILIGKFDEGFRLRDPLVPDARRTPCPTPNLYPKWQGESLENKTIVIWTEFGFGDEIMFARFASVFREEYKASSVSIVCQGALVSLFKTLANVDLVVSEEDADQLPPHDYWVFPHSIPVHHSLESGGIPSQTPYFEIPIKLLDMANSLLPAKSNGRIRVGFVSKGNATHENDRELLSI